MKKLMIAAAAMASTAAFADLCNDAVEEADGCAVYNVKFTFKTLQAKDAGCKDKCADLDGDGNDDHIAYLDNTTRTFDGILWQCESSCFEGVAPNKAVGGYINYVLWDKKNEVVISPKAEYYPDPTAANGGTASPSAAKWQGGATYGHNAWNEQLQFAILGRYGNKAQKVAAYWTPTMLRSVAGGYTAGVDTETITAAGFGTVDVKKNRIKSISGNAVGQLIPFTATRGATCADENLLSVLAYMCDDFKGWCCCDCIAAAYAPASGTWSIKYNSSLSKGKKGLSSILPSYAWFNVDKVTTTGTGKDNNNGYTAHDRTVLGL